ncbi:hypothetical protein VTN49DRAFT_6927 [Thermomyces lanuginosus]|uniref:uncharacterized protein n=1 Tax=Thermomyces lanuginosus TaxID=5541 RepID=UPI003741FC26
MTGEGFEDPPSLSTSLEDMDAHFGRASSPLLEIPSQHSGFRSEGMLNSDDSDSDDEPEGPPERWSPPGFKLPGPDMLPNGNGGWFAGRPYRHDEGPNGIAHHHDDDDNMGNYEMKPTLPVPALAPPARPQGSRESSPRYEDALEAPLPDVPVKRADNLADVDIAANVPLPPGTDSPLKGRSVSPEPVSETSRAASEMSESKSTVSNYFRFALRAEVQHREPFVALFTYFKNKFDQMTSTRTNTLLSVTVLLISLIIGRALFLPAAPQPVPDLVKLAAFARSFEPLIHYSENGVQQITTLQETGVAVWDLGESLRGTNMTSAPIIVNLLDELSESYKALSLELTRFFANVDSDIDSILLVMDWARRELRALSSQPPSSVAGLMIDNLHTMITGIGFPDLSYRSGSSSGSGNSGTNGGDDGDSSSMSVGAGYGGSGGYLESIVTAVLGPTSTQRTRAALMRTFTEFLNVLEESINNELTHSSALFALFEAIDHQFLNLQRVVVRESDDQERAEGEMLSSLWTRVLGANAALVRKYEKNRKLLLSVRTHTVANKHMLMDHQNRLLTLKVNLETLRRKLVSPLVRPPSNDSSGESYSINGGGSNGRGQRSGGHIVAPIEAVIESQISSIEDSLGYLQGVRERQKAKLMEMVYGAGSHKAAAQHQQATLRIDSPSSETPSLNQ